MIRDWDLWPWTVNEQANGQFGVHMYRMQRSVDRMTRVIGERLLPAFESFGMTMRDATAVFESLRRSLPWDPDALAKVGRLER